MKQNPTIRPATIEDIPAVVDLVNKESRFYTGSSEMAADELRTEWSIPGFAMERDTRIAVLGSGRVIGYADFYNNREPPVRPFAFVCVDPDTFTEWEWRSLIAWIEERGREDLTRGPHGARITLLTGTHEHNSQLLDEYLGAGYTEDRRYYDMQIDFDGPPSPARIPDGYGIRVINPDEGRRVYDAMQIAFQDHYGVVPASDPEQGYTRWKHFFLESQGSDPELQIIAVDSNDNVAGGCLCKSTHGEDEGMAWVSSLAVLKEHRRKGLAEALLRRSFENFYGLGKPRAGLGVDASSLTSATKLYTKCGMRPTRVFVEVAKVLRDGEELANLG